MITTGVILEGADGLHEDGWCWPRTTLSLKALAPSSTLRIEIWTKPEPTHSGRILITYGLNSAAPKADFIVLGQVCELSLPVLIDTGTLFTIHLSTPHRASRGEDLRDLSFVLSSLSLL